MKNFRFVLGALTIAVVPCVPSWAAIVVDFTSAGAASVTAGNGVFIQGATLSGTGRFPAFVQIKGTGQTDNSDPPVSDADVRDGYNTTVDGVNDNANTDTFNHEIQVSQLTKTADLQYYRFFLDINENSGGVDEYLSLDRVVILTSTTANQSSEELPTGVERYDTNDVVGGPVTVFMNYSLESGSGRADLELDILVSAFAGALSTDFVYLYSRFGTVGATNPTGSPPNGDYGVSDGFEEWAIQTSKVPDETPTTETPEPATLAIWSLGIVGLGLVASRRRNRLAA